jgi:hypothetical protein
MSSTKIIQSKKRVHSKTFSIRLSDAEQTVLERARLKRGLRSWSKLIKESIYCHLREHVMGRETDTAQRYWNNTKETPLTTEA